MEFLLDAHTHTLASGHAFSTFTENVGAAKKAGLRLMAVTDHGPLMPGSAHELHFIKLKTLPTEIDGVKIYPGVELNILNDDGAVDLSERALKLLKVIIASFHGVCMQPVDKGYHTRAIVNAMHNPYIRIIGHLCDPDYPFHIDEVVNAAKATGTIIELNNKCLKPGSRRTDFETAIKMFKMCNEKNVHMIAASDAHYHTDVGNLVNAKEMARQAGVKPELILNTDLEKFIKIIEDGKTV